MKKSKVTINSTIIYQIINTRMFTRNPLKNTRPTLEFPRNFPFNYDFNAILIRAELILTIKARTQLFMNFIIIASPNLYTSTRIFVYVLMSGVKFSPFWLFLFHSFTLVHTQRAKPLHTYSENRGKGRFWGADGVFWGVGRHNGKV